MAYSVTENKASKAERDSAKKHAYWVGEIDISEKENKKWQDKSKQVVKRFLDERDAVNSSMKWFNIFNTNVQIMASSLYSNLPKVDVSRAHHDPNDDVARVASKILQRCVEEDLCEIDCVMRHTIEDRLVPGLGMAWLRLEVQTTTDADGLESIENQKIAIDYVYWQDILWSPCRVWEDHRWVARKVHMTRDELKKRFGDELGARVPLDYQSKKDGDDLQPEYSEEYKQACVYEIWDRINKKVCWIVKGLGQVLDEKEDPMKLENFEPFPMPMLANTSTSNFKPKADFVMLQDQYHELDDINNRVSLLTIACKVTGVYDRSSDGVQRMLTEGYDNTLIPVDNWAMFAEKGGLKGQVDWLPLDMVVTALEKLITQREIVKQQIYELTGISDIVRGNTKASETLGAQELKSKFASVRIQKLQDEMVRFGEQILCIKAEMICKFFTPQQILEMANVPSMPIEDQQLVPQAIELLKGNWEKFEWRVTIAADSMAAIDWERQKTERSEFMNSVATFLQSSSSVGQGAPQLIPLMLELLKFGVAGFKVSKEVEGIFDRYIGEFNKEIEAQKSAPPKPSPEEQKAQTEMQLKQADLQMKQAGQQADLQLKQIDKQTDLQMKREEHQMKLAQMQQEFELKMAQMQQEFELKMSELAETSRIKQSVALMEAGTKATVAAADEDRTQQSFESEQERADEAHKAELKREPKNE